jgi:hypothetical protein
MGTVRGSDINGNSVEVSVSQPQQLSLFQQFLGAAPQDYGNSIELYDAIPKIMPSAKEMDGMRKDGIYLPILERRFRHRDREYRVKITPARIQNKQGAEKEFYPSHRDWMVEEALRKLACDRSNGVYLDQRVGVQFSLSELRRELSRWGRGITYDNLMESLAILSKTQLYITCSDGSVALNSTVFPVSLLAKRQQWLENPTASHCYVQFNPLVTASIDKLTYRQFNYCTFMSLRGSLSQWLHRRLSHVYTHASPFNPYRIRLSTIVRDSGMVNTARMADDAKQVRLALRELVEKGVLMQFEEEAQRGKRRMLIDVMFTFLPAGDFVMEMKRANKRWTDGRSGTANSKLLVKQPWSRYMLEARSTPKTL